MRSLCYVMHCIPQSIRRNEQFDMELCISHETCFAVERAHPAVCDEHCTF